MLMQQYLIPELEIDYYSVCAFPKDDQTGRQLYWERCYGIRLCNKLYHLNEILKSQKEFP